MTESEAAPRPMQLVQEDEGEGPPPMDPAGPGGSGREGEGDSGDGESLESSLSQTSLLTYSGNEEVTIYLSQLVGSYDTHKLTEACKGLTEAMQDADEACLQLLCEGDVVGVIVKLMEELPTHYGLQKMFCDILFLCNEKVELRTAIDDHSTYRVVLEVLKKHRERPELLGKALRVLASIASTTMKEGPLREAMVFKTVVSLLRDHSEDVAVQSGGLQALAHLLRHDGYAAATVVLQDDHKLILNSLEQHRDNAAVVTGALNALEVVCGTDQGMVSLLNGPALQLTVEAMLAFCEDVEVIRGGCGVVDTLADTAIKYPSSQFQTGLEQNQVTELLVTILQQFSTHVRIQVLSLSALGNLLLLPLPSLASLNSYSLLRLIHRAFEAFASDVSLQEAACRCLARLMERSQDLHHFIGRESPKIQFPLHDSVWLVLLDQTKNANPKVFQSVALALYYLAVDSEVLHSLLLEKGAMVALLEAVREFLHEFSRDELSVEYGCRALVALLMQNCPESEKNYLYQLNIVGDMTAILDIFKFDPGVISEAFGVITCLSSLPVCVEAIGRVGVHRQILRSMKQHAHHSVLAESGLEVIIVLSQDDTMNIMLNEVVALDCIAALMKHHINSTLRVLVEDIGADVNLGGGGFVGKMGRAQLRGGRGDHTPICLAVLSGKKSMVELLLSLGATNVHPALQLAREQGLDDITGILLKNLGLDRNGETVNLSGLDLTSIKPQWILPCLGVSDTLRRSLVRHRSFDRIKDLFLHRKSIGCIEDKNLELLRTKMERLLRESEGEGGGSESGGGDFEGSDEPDSEEVLPSHGFHRTHSDRSSLPSFGLTQPRVTNTAPLTPPSTRVREDGARPRSVPLESPDFHKAPFPLSLPATPNRSQPGFRSGLMKVHGAGGVSLAFQPTLPPICGTPVGSLHRFSFNSPSSPSGDALGSPTSPLVPLPPGREGVGPQLVGGESLGTLVRSSSSMNSEGLPQPPRTPQRRHHEKLNSLMIQRSVAGQRQLFPPSSSHLHPVTTPHPTDSPDGLKKLVTPVTPQKRPSNISPSVLLRRVSLWAKKRAREHGARKLSTPSSNTTFSQPDSPTARIFTDLTALSEDSCDSTPISSDIRRPWRVSTDEGISTGPTPIPMGNARNTLAVTNLMANRSAFSPLSPGSDSTDGGEDLGLFSPTSSTSTTFRNITHSRRRKSSSSLSSQSACTNAWSDDARSISRAGDGGLVFRNDVTKFQSYNGSEVREKVFSARLVKVLDLSSNLLSELEVMVGGSDHVAREERERGELVLQRLRGLQRLDLKQNRLSRLPPSLVRELRKLSTLNLSCNVFEELRPDCMLSGTLTSLDLSANQITSIPDLPVLPNLTKILLSDNLLTQFPAAINGTSLPHLRVLALRSNKLCELSEGDPRLGDLEELYLSKNSLQEVPDLFLASMISLKTLDLSHNQLELLPGERAEDMVELVTLRVGHNKLGRRQAEFNLFITSAPVLRTLDATENELSLLPPPRAWRSCGLKDLRLNGNSLTSLDLDKCEKFWPHLETLYIGQNKLREIPKEIGQLRTLNCLDISHNDIRHLPDELGLLDHLFLLNLQGLDRLSLDPTLLKGPTKNITAFLKSRRVKSVPYYQMKLMMVGGPGRGKTTLLHQLIQEKLPSHSRNNIATLGVSVKQWSYVTDSKTYHINCWDFAGQEEFYSTHQCFLTSRSIYLVVYDISKGESELSCLIPWLLNVQARAPSSPVIIIGTHIDKINKDEYDFRRLQMRTKIQDTCRRPGFPGNLAFSEVDCFNDKMLATLRKKVKEQINSAQLRGQKIMGGLVPHNYVLLSEVVQQEKRRLAKYKSRFPVLTSERLHSIMAAGKLQMEKAELEQAIRFLHESGVLLHYPDVKSNLSKLYFLEPEWLCSLMAQIVTVPEVNPLIDKQGLLQESAISHLLKDPKLFPFSFRKEYIRLLERFEVVLSHTPQTLLIPSRLPRRKPMSVVLPPASPGCQIVRRYLFLYIPPGFWPRLVARLITFPKRTLPHYIKGNLQGKLEMWAEGLFYYWSEQAFFLVESREGMANVLDIVVPASMVGTKLLCSVVDNIEHLIDEWFPGLRDIDTSTGRDLVCPLALCPQCPVSCEPHCFVLSDLQQVSTSSDHILCPEHGGKVMLEHLAPDIIISDLDSKFKVLPSEFCIEESSANLLGSGGFGAVYKAMYRGKPVAVKVFSDKTAKINNTTPNYLLRLEVSILSQLEHPHIISLVGVCMRPRPMLLLEYAQLGSLRSLHPYNHLSNQLKHRIALQVVSALAYLHKQNIIYRDLKADNVLIFSLSLVTKVNAKLSDYGIACTATEMGLTQPIGTRGCKAPELLKAPTSYTTYNEKVDIYSYGLLMFTVMSNGHKPHEELTDPHEIDKAIEEGRPIRGLEEYGCPPWPDMEDLVTHCLHYQPQHRPSAQEVFDRLCCPEFICLKRAVQMAYDCNMETVALRTFRDKTESSRSVEVWMASTIEQQTMLSIVNLSERIAAPKGFMIPLVKVYSMVAVQSSHVLLGTDSGQILVYDGYSRKKSHQFSPLHDPVLCLQYFKCSSLGSYALYAGLANGQLAIYDEYMIPCPDAKPSSVIELGPGPIRNIFQHHSCLYVSCGPEVAVIRAPQHTVDTRWRAVHEPNCFVTCVELSQGMVWTAQNRSPVIHTWDMEDGHSHRGDLNCDAMLRTLLPHGTSVDSRGSRVTSMLLQPHPHSVMWVGLGSGQLLLISAPSRNPLMVVHRHVSAIRVLQCQKVPVSDKTLHLILSAGFGFKQRPGEEASFKGTPEMYGNLLIWDAIMPRLKTMFEDMHQQQEVYR